MAPTPDMAFDVLDWGLIDYSEALKLQLEKVEERKSDTIKDTLIFCSHPSVVTLGRASLPEDLMGWTGKVEKTNRGGRATYHGPQQLVVYPIIKIKDNPGLSFPDQDVRAYLEFLEDVIIDVLSGFELKAEKVSSEPLEAGQLNRGVWVSGKKIASIGIAVKAWVTHHGLALNVGKDSLAFQGIKACGFDSSVYTSLEELGSEVTASELASQFVNSFKVRLKS